MWHTDLRLLGRSEYSAACSMGGTLSLYGLACDVAELYHQGFSVQLQDGREEQGAARRRFRIIWLELTADEALLVFLKPLRDPHRAAAH